mgnify:FL=1|tara:strand:- start:50738 stop:51313 length:576 start_codon:yes stop_codon:yes gene_type:complete
MLLLKMTRSFKFVIIMLRESMYQKIALLRFYVKFNAYPGYNSIIPNIKNISMGENCVFGDYNHIFCQDPEKGSSITIGSNFATNNGVTINADLGGNIKIGNNVLIGPNVTMRAANHVYSSIDAPISTQGHVCGYITIEDDVWIGSGVIILPNVTIGTGSVIGAGSVITKDIPSFSVSVGVPARKIKDRTNC